MPELPPLKYVGPTPPTQSGGRRDRELVVSVVQTRPHPSTDRYREAIVKGLGQRSFGVVVSTPRPVVPAAVPGLTRAAEYVRRWIQQPAATKRVRADVFHLVDDNGPVTRVLPAERVVVTCHDLILLLAAEGSIPYDGPRWYIHRFRAGTAYLRHVAAVVCPTEAVRRDVIRLCGVEPARVHAIRHGIEEHFIQLPPERRTQIRRELGISAAYVLLHIGTGGFYKNVPVTLATLSLLRQSGHDVVLVRVGRKLVPAERAEHDRLGLEGAVLDLGHVSERRLVELYNAADVLLFPSLAEGFGWPVLESMACGTPVVASDVPALREVGGSSILYAPADSPRAHADAVGSLLASPERRSSAVEAVLARAGSFTWQRAFDAYAALYRDVAAAAATPAR
jgi:glycosyltransferase involved in cell wall biosynthesis